MSGNDVQMLHERLLRIEGKQDETLIRLGEGARRMDAIESKADAAVAYGPRIEALEGTNKRALAAWGVFTVVGAAISGVAWDWIKRKLGV